MADAHACLIYWDSQVVDVHMFRYCVMEDKPCISVFV